MKLENVTCPECEGPMVPRTSSHGKFWGCKSFPKCRGLRDANGDAKRERSQWRPLGARSDEPSLPSDRQRGNDRRRWS